MMKIQSIWHNQKLANLRSTFFSCVNPHYTVHIIRLWNILVPKRRKGVCTPAERNRRIVAPAHREVRCSHPARLADSRTFPNTCEHLGTATVAYGRLRTPATSQLPPPST